MKRGRLVQHDDVIMHACVMVVWCYDVSHYHHLLLDVLPLWIVFLAKHDGRVNPEVLREES